MAYEQLRRLWPLLYRVVLLALEKDECPLKALKDLMDSEEAAALVAEWEKFRR